METVIELAVGTIATLVIYGVSIWLNNNYFGPRRKAQLQNRSPLLDLKKNGFSAVSPIDVGDGSTSDKSVGYVGVVDGYAIEIAFNFLTGWLTVFPYFRIRVFFDPGSVQVDALQKRLTNDISRSKVFRWNDDKKLTFTYAEQEVSTYKSSLPKSQYLLAIVKELTNELKSLGLLPIEYEAGVNLTRKIAE